MCRYRVRGVVGMAFKSVTGDIAPTVAPSGYSEQPMQGGEPQQHFGLRHLTLSFTNHGNDLLFWQVVDGGLGDFSGPSGSVVPQPCRSGPPQGMADQLSRGYSSGSAVSRVLSGNVSSAGLWEHLLNGGHAVCYERLPPRCMSLNPVKDNPGVGPQEDWSCRQT